jgi:hypothetical protein
MKAALLQKPEQKTSANPKRISKRDNSIFKEISSHPVLNLQQTIGNQAVLRMLKSGTLQTKPCPINIQRKCAECEEGEEPFKEKKAQEKFHPAHFRLLMK